MLKIIAGLAKGRVLKTGPPLPSLRPILARIKKSLFDILTPRLAQSQFLDLYAGTGAVGLEALSRGAAFTVFVEKDRQSVRLIRDNLDMLAFADKAQIYSLDVLTGLSRIKNETFDIIFMGPPYKDKGKEPLRLVSPTLAAILQADLLKRKTGLIVAQHHKKEEIDIPDKTLELFRQERYGDTLLSFFRWTANP